MLRPTNLAFAVAAITAIGLSACAPPEPPLPYLTVGEYSGRCGYDWNGAAIDLAMLPELVNRWSKRKAVLMVFHFEPVPDQCKAEAREAFSTLGFTRIYVVSMKKPANGDPPIMP